MKIDGRWREKSTRTQSYAEAKKVRQAALQAQIEGRLPTDRAQAKLEAVSEKWLEDRKKLVAHQTWRIDKERMKPLTRAFGHKRLCDITSDDIRAYQVKRAGEVSNRTVNLEMKVLRQILKTCRLWARIADDYTRMPENTKGPGRALSDEEEKRLFSTARSNPRWEATYYAALLASNTTARGCELKGLRLEDVDLMKGEMKIRRVTTKNDAGCRVVPLNDTAKWAVARLLERDQLLGCIEPTHYLFPACEHGHIDPTCHQKSWRTAWRNLTRKANFKGLRFHDLRHHCITRLAEKGVPEQTLMAIAGHLSRQMLEHYSHVRMQAKREAVKAIDSFKPADSTAQEQQPVH